MRAMGNLGLTCSSMGFGCMGMSGTYGPADEAESRLTIREALDRGVTMFDTADIYGNLSGERLVGTALAGRRDEVIIASKFGGAELDDDGNVTGGTNGTPQYVRRSVERSLRALGTDRIDLYYQHRVDPQVPVEETFGALGELVVAGKIRYVGICEAAPGTIRRAHGATPLSAVQTEFSLFSRQVESNGVLATARELGIGFVASSPLGRGILTGALRTAEALGAEDLRTYYPRFQPGSFEHNLRVARDIEETAATYGMSLAQFSLAWLLGAGDDVVAIPGTRTREHMRENLVAAQMKLDEPARRRAAAQVETGEVLGARRSSADPAIEE
ncbi:aldo/keto reductase [Streptomyces olivaceus]|uniref:aldo/keto reductase n=1 Tax=Streptomyces TaxID=1883 RepID=UPI0030C76377